MGQNTKIEWARHTFNPWVGCTKVSPACDHCYAEAWAKRTGHPELWQAQRRRTSNDNWRQPLKWNRAAAAAGERHRVFCASLADVFDNQVPEQWREDLWGLIRDTPNLDWLLLTKRPQNIAKMLPAQFDDGDRWPERWPNVWLGTTVENQEEADRRIPHLLAVPAKVRFLSCEPLLGPVDLFSIKTGLYDWTDALRGTKHAPELTGSLSLPMTGNIHWVICGGESGPKARPMQPKWAFSLQRQCQSAGVPFFFKQWGEWAPTQGALLGSIEMARVGKKEAGRRLGGFEWDESPRAA